jgi:septum formation topological specificity factor MinE
MSEEQVKLSLDSSGDVEILELNISLAENEENL